MSPLIVGPALMALAMLLASGCTPHNPKSITYYHFDTVPGEGGIVDPLELPRLELLPTRLTAHLDSPAIVQRIDSQRVATANWHHWAVEPGTMLDRAALDTLEQGLPGWFVVRRAQRLASAAHPRSAPGYRLQFELVRFNGGLHGDAELAGSWRLYNDTDQLLYRARFTRVVALSEDGYPGLVQALQDGWLAVCERVAGYLLAQPVSGADD